MCVRFGLRTRAGGLLQCPALTAAILSSLIEIDQQHALLAKLGGGCVGIGLSGLFFFVLLLLWNLSKASAYPSS